MQKTIDVILEHNGYTREQLESCSSCNGCGGKGGFDFNKAMTYLPAFDNDKRKELLKDLYLICSIHDIKFSLGGGYKTFLKANYNLSKNIIQLLHWTNSIARVVIFILVFGGTTIFGRKYFNWK